jgi:1-acyl-sn-glycerol-3-phosphate acyltransferase
MSLPAWLRVSLAFTLILGSTAVHVLPLFVITLVKALLPMRAPRAACNRGLQAIVESWSGFNDRMINTLTRTRVRVSGSVSLDPAGHYLVLANHQSWVDILIMQKVLNRRIPLPRYFLKSQLFWVPLFGLAWWALDFPFMKRYTREQIARRPEFAGRDIETTRRACAKFRSMPVAVTNFVEGTRFTPAKHAVQKSPYRHLLRPKSGGVAFVIGAMGDSLQTILDLTFVYPAGLPTIIDLFANRVPEVLVDIRERPIPHELIDGDYQCDAAFRARFQTWMNALWEEKDANIDRMLAGQTLGVGERPL